MIPRLVFLWPRRESSSCNVRPHSEKFCDVVFTVKFYCKRDVAKSFRLGLLKRWITYQQVVPIPERDWKIRFQIQIRNRSHNTTILNIQSSLRLRLVSRVRKRLSSHFPHVYDGDGREGFRQKVRTEAEGVDTAAGPAFFCFGE